jgi:ABC-type sugar transport system ATPase subunit
MASSSISIPLDGTACGGDHFTWTAAIWLAWASPALREAERWAPSLKSVEKVVRRPQVIKGVDLTIADGEFVVFVGPSGCGKSTLLRMIGGLEDISRGTLIDGRDVDRGTAVQARAAMVFQSYALYPHMSVRDNMGFPLKTAGAPKAEIEKRWTRPPRS